MANETSMPTFTIEEFTSSDGYRLHYRRYAATGTPRAHIVCIHGIQSHAGWYEYSCGRLSQAGYTVSFFDRRGSGLNTQDRGDAPSFRRLLDDLAEFLQTLRESKESPAGSRALPVFLLAISWGGKLAVALQRRHPGLIDGLALLCPGFFPRVKPSLRERCAIVWARLVSPTRLFPVPLNEPELFTANPRWQKFITDDALSLREATARLLVESVRLDAYLRWCAGRVEVPVLLLLAGKDRIIDNGRTRQYVDRFATKDKEVIEYPDAHHTLEFELDPDRFINDVQKWIERIS